MAKNYKNAFNCKKCPGTSDELGCPKWTSYVATNNQTGAVKVVKGCLDQLLPEIIISFVAASDRVTENLSALPHRLATVFSKQQEALRKISG